MALVTDVVTGSFKEITPLTGSVQAEGAQSTIYGIELHLSVLAVSVLHLVSKTI